MRNTFVEAFSKLAQINSKLFLITADLGFGTLTDFSKKHQNQFLNIGVAEQNMTGVATGMALEGRIVFTYSIANFPTLRCLEQIRNDAAYHDANVKIISVGGGFSYGSLGMSHHATEDLAIMRALPITVIAPGDLYEVKEATKAIIEIPGVCYMRLDHSKFDHNIVIKNKRFMFGKGRRVLEGNDVTLIVTGGILNEALEAANYLLQEYRIKCRVISMHTLNPIDKSEIYAASKETGGIITIEEHTVYGGLGGIVAEVCLESGILPKFFYRIGLRSGFSSIVGSQQHLRGCYKMDKNAIVYKVLSFCKI